MLRKVQNKIYSQDTFLKSILAYVSVAIADTVDRMINGYDENDPSFLACLDRYGSYLIGVLLAYDACIYSYEQAQNRYRLWSLKKELKNKTNELSDPELAKNLENIMIWHSVPDAQLFFDSLNNSDIRTWIAMHFIMREIIITENNIKKLNAFEQPDDKCDIKQMAKNGLFGKMGKFLITKENELDQIIIGRLNRAYTKGAVTGLLHTLPSNYFPKEICAHISTFFDENINNRSVGLVCKSAHAEGKIKEQEERASIKFS